MKQKIITICGSMKFKDIMLKEYDRLSNKGYIVFLPILNLDTENNNDSEFSLNLHKQKIDLSDIVYIINEDNYIGKSTSKELEYAKLKNKVIMFYYHKETLFNTSIEYKSILYPSIYMRYEPTINSTYRCQLEYHTKNNRCLLKGINIDSTEG